MRRLFMLTATAIAILVRAAPGAHATDGSTFSSTPNSGDSLFGYHVYGTETNNRGFVLDYDSTGNLGWSLGLERTFGDLYLYNYNYYSGGVLSAANNTPFRLRGDTGQIELGTSIGHPISSNQLNVTAGRDTAPVIALDGLGISINGIQSSINLTQRGNPATIRRTAVTFGTPTSGFQIGTDSAGIGTNDWYLKNLTTGTVPLEMWYGNNVLNIGYGANVTGTLTVSGALTHTGSTLGFYNAAPITKPVVTGCRSDGTALQSLLQALQSQGLIVNSTTP
jgi:hypothetical protein